MTFLAKVFLPKQHARTAFQKAKEAYDEAVRRKDTRAQHAAAGWLEKANRRRLRVGA